MIGILDFVATAAEGQRNRFLFWGAARIAEKVRDNVLSLDLAEAALREAAAMNGLEAREAEATIRSAFRIVS